ncbi:hypothetical protein BJF78_34060 [Pseudonocardia sp. CNS-139]|nr:hypothetical protein BJF78_34060 [Pseudonocardia sp. CNS-139]
MGIGETLPAGGTGGGPGSTQELARLAGTTPPASIPEVVERLAAIRDHAASTSLLGEDDGIAAFTRLYHVITAHIGEMADRGEFRSPEFLIRLDIEFAERYFDALRAYARDMSTCPRVWRVVFDNRSNPNIPAVNFAVAGVNAHINFDLSCAVVATWHHVPPRGDTVLDTHYHDYRLVNEVFEAEMDPLREDLDSLLSHGPDGAIWDRTANWMADLVVRFTRDLAWDEARRVWAKGGDEEDVRESEAKLDAIATFIGETLVRTPVLPI